MPTHRFIFLRNRPYLLLTMSLAISFLAGEVFLRVSGVTKTWSERWVHGWTNQYGVQLPHHYHLFAPDISFRNANPEFDYLHTTNKLGYVGPLPDADKIGERIVFIGDSFTEGVGASSPDSSCPKLFQNILRRNYPQEAFEVLNFGVGGNDVVYATKYLMDSTARFNPDLVIMMFNSTDISDIAQRGGWDRFMMDGTTRFQRGPWFLPLFRHLHLFRLLIINGLKYDSELLIPKERVEQTIRNALEESVSTAIKADSLVRGFGAEFLFVLMPTGHELATHRERTSIQFMGVQQTLENHNINVLNLWEVMAKNVNSDNVERYSWTHDGHYKHTGYLMIAEIIASSSQFIQLLGLHQDDKRCLSPQRNN
jgi:lysophospholipase L1-like esterase